MELIHCLLTMTVVVPVSGSITMVLGSCTTAAWGYLYNMCLGPFTTQLQCTVPHKRNIGEKEGHCLHTVVVVT